jgi:hypothetical protein
MVIAFVGSITSTASSSCRSLITVSDESYSQRQPSDNKLHLAKNEDI